MCCSFVPRGARARPAVDPSAQANVRYSCISKILYSTRVSVVSCRPGGPLGSDNSNFHVQKSVMVRASGYSTDAADALVQTDEEHLAR